MNAWSHLPNAHHIDRVLESAKSHPEIWAAAWDAAWNASMAAWNAAWNATMNAARGVARDVAWDAARGVVCSAAAARGATAALIAYDDASKYLEMPGDHLRIWAILSEDPAAVLLLPAVIAFERISELECV
jgi:hypothetical protein